VIYYCCAKSEESEWCNQAKFLRLEIAKKKILMQNLFTFGDVQVKKVTIKDRLNNTGYNSN
jgi:hypothetical protein